MTQELVELAKKVDVACGIDKADGMNNFENGWYFSTNNILPLIEDSESAAKSEYLAGPYVTLENCQGQLLDYLEACDDIED